MSYLLWLVLVPVDLVTGILGRLLAPLVAPFASADGWLPAWLWWFQTPDNSLDGDGGWKNEHAQWRFKLPAALAVYVGRVGWLWRNNMYGFDIGVSGASLLGTDKLTVQGDEKVSDSPAHSGYVFRRVYRDDRLVAWQLYIVWVWMPGRCLRINLGWKLWSFLGVPVLCQYAFYLNPVKGAK